MSILRQFRGKKKQLYVMFPDLVMVFTDVVWWRLRKSRADNWLLKEIITIHSGLRNEVNDVENDEFVVKFGYTSRISAVPLTVHHHHNNNLREFDIENCYMRTFGTNSLEMRGNLEVEKASITKNGSSVAEFMIMISRVDSLVMLHIQDKEGWGAHTSKQGTAPGPDVELAFVILKKNTTTPLTD